MNFIGVLFSVFSFGIGLAGLIQIIQPKTPQFFQDLLLYGKLKGKRDKYTVVRQIEVPKRWFLHMYIAGILVNGSILFAVVSTLFGSPIIDWQQYLPKQRIINIDDTTALITLICIMIQVSRRAIECLFLHVFSKSGTMNVMHYFLGITFYSMLGIAVMIEAPVPKTFKGLNISVSHIVGVAMFLWSSWQHFSAHSILAGLRTNGKGKVHTEKHLIPKGGWFDMVSCPHYLMEIMTYISLAAIQTFANSSFLFILMFVIVNQILAAYLTHIWYVKTFPQYPKQRKAVIPFVL